LEYSTDHIKTGLHEVRLFHGKQCKWLIGNKAQAIEPVCAEVHIAKTVEPRKRRK
jgi:hypothetical protein